MRTLKLIWAALLVSIVIYGVLAVLLARPWPAPTADPLTNPIVLGLGFAAVMSLGLSFFFPKILLRSSQSVERVRLASIMQWALIETIAIYGLLGALLTQDKRVFFAFGAVALAAMLLAFPRTEGDQTPQRAT